jgi:DnaJ-domain-containing protein 1
VAKCIHPDLATDENDRTRRQHLMAEANQVYEDGDEARLREILREWESSPEVVKGDGIGAELVRTIRKIAQIRERLLRIEAEIEELKRSELHQLKMEMDKGVVEGRDLLEEMKSRLDEQIVAARSRLRGISLMRPTP